MHGPRKFVPVRYTVFLCLSYSANVVSFDFLGHGDSPAPNNPELYTADEVSWLCLALWIE